MFFKLKLLLMHWFYRKIKTLDTVKILLYIRGENLVF